METNRDKCARYIKDILIKSTLPMKEELNVDDVVAVIMEVIDKYVEASRSVIVADTMSKMAEELATKIGTNCE